jgi:ParB-like chromosome segregation protein Spo0J
MTGRRIASQVPMAFEEATLRIAVTDILPLREVTSVIQSSVKYAQIASSIQEVGIIEPPVVIRDRTDRSKFCLLDGHLRLDVLRKRGDTEVVCLIAIEDEAFTYNKRVSRLAIIQEHKMILNAVKRGVPEERLARALNVNISNIRAKRNLLVGICPEAADLLRDKHLSLNTFIELRRLKPMRQIEAAELMVAMNRFSKSYAQSLVAATPDEQMVEGRRKAIRGLTIDQMSLMEKESESLDREFKMIEQTYGADHLDLVLATGYITRLLGNARVVRHLAQQHPDILNEFQKISNLQMAA